MIRSRALATVAAPAAIALTALAATGCGGSGNAAAPATVTPPKTANGRPATLGTASVGRLGKILVDSRGRTLYLFQRDSRGKSACSGDCAVDWPPLRDSGTPVVGAGANSALVGTTPRSDGKRQVTYNGHPLYLFAGDKAPGQTNGQGLTAFGGGWFALSGSGNRVSGASSGSASGSGGGNGY
jgi:predicted lipoprotein with Yx(FWY)xxD motif